MSGELNLPTVFLELLLTRSFLFSLIAAVIIGLPAATPAEFKNTAKYAFGNFENCKNLDMKRFPSLMPLYNSQRVAIGLCIYPQFLGSFVGDWYVIMIIFVLVWC